MGTSSSRIGGEPPIPSRACNRHSHRPRHNHPRPSFRRNFSSLFICGGGSSSRPRDEIEDDPPEILVNSSEDWVNSSEDCDMEKIQILAKNSSLSTGTGLQYSDPGTRVSSGRSMFSRENLSTSDVPGNSVAGDKGKSLSQNVESSPQLIAAEKASPSYRVESSPESVSSNGLANGPAVRDVVNTGNRITNRDATLNFPRLEQSSCPSTDDLEESSDEVSVENIEREMLLFHDCDSSSDSSIDNTLQTSSSGLGFLVSEREEGSRNGNALQVDVVSISSDTLSVGSTELNNHEARWNSRRLFWDPFSRRSSRSTDSRSFVLTTDDADGLGSHDRWLLDLSSDLFDDGIGGDSRRYGNSNQITNERRWHSSSEIWERFRDVGRIGSGHRTTICPSGIHPDGTCACGSTLRGEESGVRASISRIVMLAEALFEVLDEIHRQPMSLSLSMVSLPAPESVVDSLPVKYYRKPESGDDVAQCYICLDEYDEGDEIRVLPCHHELHLSCVDKWLKEIHGVCPLCRGDVRDAS